MLNNLGLLHVQQGRTTEAYACYEQALAIHEEVGERRLEGVFSGNLGDLLYATGDLAAAERHLRRAITICDEVWPAVAGAFRGSLAVIRAERGELAGARALFSQGESQLRGVHSLELAKLLCKRAPVERRAGDRAAARRALAEAESIAAQLDARPESELGRAIAEVRVDLADNHNRTAPFGTMLVDNGGLVDQEELLEEEILPRPPPPAQPL